MKRNILMISLTTIGIVIVVVTLLLVIPRKEQVVITIFGDFSSGENSFAQLGMNGAMMMIEEVNEASEDVTYVLEQVDSSMYSSEEDILAAFEDRDTDIIIGPFLSSRLTVYAQMLMDSDYMVFVPSATHDVITGKEDNVFRLMNATSIQGSQTAQLFDRLGYDKIYAIYDTNNQSYTKEIVDYFKEDDSLTGATVTTFELVDTARDFRNDITVSYDAIFICGSGDRTGAVINTIRNDNITKPIFLCSYSDSAIFLDQISHDVNDVYLYSNRNVQFENAYDIFSANYLSRFGTVPSVPSTYAYESLYFLHKQLELADYDMDLAMEQINALESYRGIFVNFFSNDNGDFYSLMTIYDVDNKMFIPVLETQID